MLVPSSKKVAFVIPCIAAGGAELQAISQISKLRELGLDVHLIVLSSTIDNQILSKANLPPDRLLLLKKPGLLVLGKSFVGSSIESLKSVYLFLKKNDISDVVAFMGAGVAFARMLKAYCTARFKKFRLIAYHHGLEHSSQKNRSRASRAFNMAMNFLGYWVDNEHWHVSPQVREDIERHKFSRNDWIIENAVDTSVADDSMADIIAKGTGWDSAGFKIVIPGRLVPEKGHIFILEVFSEFAKTVASEDPKFSILVAGDGRLRDEIEAKTRSADLESQVHLTGTVTRSTLFDLFKQADLVVVPSFFEGFGNVVIEALIQECLILTSNAGGLSNIIEDGVNGWQVPAGDHDAFLQRLLKIYHGRSEKLDLAAARDRAMKRYDFDTHVEKIYRRITQSDVTTLSDVHTEPN